MLQLNRIDWTICMAQAYYLAAPFAIERAPTVSVRGIRRTAAGGVTVVQLSDYPVRLDVRGLICIRPTRLWPLLPALSCTAARSWKNAWYMGACIA